jgi:hypothetical protein
MSTLGLNTVRNTPSVNVLPAQQSLVLADSRYRPRGKFITQAGDVVQEETEDQTPYNFQANFSAALVGKEILYSKLHWNQPIYAHNTASCEFKFQMNNNTDITYVVYALPFMMYNEYDGNPPGVAWGTPQPFSYADMMEKAFNGDVRRYFEASKGIRNYRLIEPPDNAVAPALPGYLYDSSGNKIVFRFRYSASQGFCISMAPPPQPSSTIYTIRLLPCDYIANAHYVHGFGVFDSSQSETTWVPRPNFTVAYFSDDTPNLLPFRYVTVRSNELVKDRRMISFQNANANQFNTELAVIPLNPIYTGVYHTEIMREDATVISKRDDYQPSVVRFSIAQENGTIIYCDSPISNMLQTPYIVNDTVKDSFLAVTSPYRGRGNVIFVNNLVFATRLLRNSQPYRPGSYISPSFPFSYPTLNFSWNVAPYGPLDFVSTTPFVGPVVGVQKNATNTGFFNWFNADPGASVNMFRQSIPWTLVQETTNSPNLNCTFLEFPDSYAFGGVNAKVTYLSKFTLFGTPSNNTMDTPVSIFSWDPLKNPTISIYAQFRVSPHYLDPNTGSPSVYNFNTVWLYAYSYTINDIVAASKSLGNFTFGVPGTSLDYNGGIQLNLNPKYPNLTDIQQIGFFITAQSIDNYPSGNFPPNTLGMAHYKLTFITISQKTFRFYGQGLQDGQYNEIPPIGISTVNTVNNPPRFYEYGDPLADAKCEELIHEVILITDKN